MSKSSRLRGLYGITDEQLLPNTHVLLRAVEAALRGGMTILQYRVKTLNRGEQTRQAMALKKLCIEHDALFIVNDDVALAQAVEADGVHIGRDDSDIATARAQLGASAIIGCSCYNQLERAQAARQQGADYVALGRFFPSKTKPGAVQADMELLREATRQMDIPVCAIGGISLDNAPLLIEQGAHMLAVVNDLFAAASVQQQAQALSDLLTQSAD